jgi:hypothetical protein
MAAMLRNSIHATLEKFGKKTLGTIRRTEECEDFLTLIEDFDHHDELYTVTDIKQQKIIWHRGIKKWLGYEADENAPLAMDELAKYVHPYVRTWYRALMAAATLVFAGATTRALRFRFVINAPLIKENGDLCLVKIITMPFDYDEKWKAGTFMQSYFIVGQYQEEPVGLALYEGQEEMSAEIYRKIRKELLKDISVANVLSDLQVRIIHIIRELQKERKKSTTKILPPG